MTISAILSAKGTEVATIASDAPLSEAVAELGGRRIGALLVIDAGEVKGIVSERDVIYCLREHGSQILDWPVSRAMSSPAIVVTPDTAVLSAMALMTQQRSTVQSDRAPFCACLNRHNRCPEPKGPGRNSVRLFDIVGLDEGTCGRRPGLR